LIWSAVIALIAVVGGVIAVVVIGGAGNGTGAADEAAAAPFVGGDLHTVTTVGDALFVAGHSAVGVSRDQGRTWAQVPSLTDADPMGWAVTPDAVLAGGHPGVFRSSDQGRTFTQVSGAAAVPDAHALGGSGATVYAASPQAGLLASTDAGRSWQVRNPEAGRSFMGTILVDPKNVNRLIAPDMAGALATSSDGGRTWTPLGGPDGAMSAAWNPTDTSQIIAVGMNGSARSRDGGATWQRVDLPQGASAISYDSTGRTLYAGVLDGERARVYRSTDGGTTWTPTA
jgi:photosystem II stability/assembly factor-like uncharacterized protein